MVDNDPLSLKGFLDDVNKALDPFGMMRACWSVQKAWLQHPQALSRRLQAFHQKLVELNLQGVRRLSGYQDQDVISPAPYDERFQEPVWHDNPFLDYLKEFYLLYTHWLEDAIYATPGASRREREKAGFLVRQILNAVAPSNFFWTNPAAVLRFLQTGGASVVDGVANFIDDYQRGTIRIADESAFQVGRNLATTPGAVVFRNKLLEVIQYAPQTEQVHEIPIVLVAPWINKYYILDLNPEKSLVRYLVSRGFTVFVTSWKNPGSDMRDTTLDDYLYQGALQAVETARSICGSERVHLTGYCIGGTIVAALMAWLNRGGDDDGRMPVAHWTLLTTLVDFSNPGEIDVFIDEETIEYLEDRMHDKGYLDGQDMANSFRALRSNSLIWHYFVHNYLLGGDPPKFDVLYWNMDTTRMPEAMHSFYLREFYLNNKLVQPDGVELAGRPIDLRRITQPLYAVGAEQDHIAPWKETFKICRLIDGDVRYTLATSGHILGIINPPVTPPKRRYWTSDAAGFVDPLKWREKTPKVAGSWWEDWVAWLKPQCGSLTAPPPLGNEEYPALMEAPGSYVLER